MLTRFTAIALAAGVAVATALPAMTAAADSAVRLEGPRGSISFSFRGEPVPFYRSPYPVYEERLRAERRAERRADRRADRRERRAERRFVGLYLGDNPRQFRRSLRDLGFRAIDIEREGRRGWEIEAVRNGREFEFDVTRRGVIADVDRD
ncbi:MAG: hypothetical protein AAF677_17750 [Pseudomonadota bacterium]